jgi:hypothetical protein
MLVLAGAQEKWYHNPNGQFQALCLVNIDMK